MSADKTDPTVAQVIDSMTKEKQNALYWLIGSVLDIDVPKNYKAEFRSMSRNEKKVLTALLEKAVEHKLFE